MELSLSLQEHLARSAMLHSRLCPRQVLGVRMARIACGLLGIDPAFERKSIYVFMEIGRCAADAVMIVTGASPTNGHAVDGLWQSCRHFCEPEQWRGNPGERTAGLPGDCRSKDANAAWLGSAARCLPDYA